MGELTLAEAIAIRLTYTKVAYPSKALRHILAEAEKVVDEAASAASSRIQDGICTRCWGDGFHRTSHTLLSGPCEACNGTGRTPNLKGGAE